MKEILGKIMEKLRKVPKLWYLVIGLAVVLVAALVLCFVLIGRENRQPDPTTVPTTTAAPVETTEETVPETTEAKELRHPLNGELLDEPFVGRTMAIVTPNDSSALPQHGIGNADMVYEIEAEGGITRCLGMYTDITFEGKIGPIRSARTYFNNVAVSYDAPIVHCGGSPGGRKGRYDDTSERIKKWRHIDEMSYGAYFYRDSDRSSAGYAYEYTLFTTGEKLLACMKEKNYSTDLENIDYKLSFGDEPTVTGGEQANVVKVGFRGGKTTTMTRNEQTGLYEAYQLGRDWVDGNTGEVLSFRNLLVLKAEQWHDDSGYRTYYDLIGEGEGYFACDGKIIPIKWVREKLKGPFSYTTLDGTPITLGVGKTYIAIASPISTTTYN